MNTTTTGASEDFIRKFNEELQNLSTLLTSPDTKLRLVELEKRLIDACIYLPLYDQKTCNSKLAAFKESLHAIAVPKPKFSFSSKFKATSVEKIVAQGVPNETAKRDALRLIPENACALTNQTGQILSPLAPSDGSEQDVYIYDCIDCIIDLRHVPVAAMHLRNIHRCVILSGLGSGSLLGHSIKESVLALGCKQFRIHDSHRVLVSLYIPTHPIIEDCSDMIFSSYPTTLPDDSYTRAGWDRRENQFAQVEDFNWHKKSHSPHWKVSEDVVPLAYLEQSIQPGLLDNNKTLLDTFLKLIHF